MFHSEKSLLLGISGGIAAYKSCEIIRHFVKLGVNVQTVMTTNASRFITATTLEALTGRPCFIDMFESKDHLTEKGSFRHIDFGRDFDVFLIAPATANVISKFANGIADDLLTTTYLCFDRKVAVAPAMNTRMWNHPSAIRNLKIIEEDGIEIIEPVEGSLACGESGIGKLAELETITSRVEKLLGTDGPWAGKRVLVTTGATREPFDPVRFISNNSTGEFGKAIARQLVRYGADVKVIEASAPYPNKYEFNRYKHVSTAQEMLDSTLKFAADVDIVFMMSAVADFTPQQKHNTKLKKTTTNDLLKLELKRTKDILSELLALPKRPILVGVSAETDDLINNSRQKLEGKKLAAILAVDVGGENRPFGAVPLTATALFGDGTSLSPPTMDKNAIARTFIDEIYKRLPS